MKVYEWLAIALCVALILVLIMHQADTMRIVEKVVEKWLDSGLLLPELSPDLK